MPEYGVVQAIRLCHQLADLLIEPRPWSIEGLRHDHLVFEQRGGLLERRLAGLRCNLQSGCSAGVRGQGVVQAQGIICRKTLQALQHVFETGAARGVDKPLPSAMEPKALPSPSVWVTCAVATPSSSLNWRTEAWRSWLASLAGHLLAQQLALGLQLVEQGGLALQRRLRTGGDKCRSQLLELAWRHRLIALQPVQLCLELVLQRCDLRFYIPGLARLAEPGIDLQQVAQRFQVGAQGQAVPSGAMPCNSTRVAWNCW